MKYIDLRSDTVTQPTQAMRDAMAAAEVGDDVYRDDPTVLRLEQLAADMLGKEAALFVASGTMGNQLCLMAHTNRGDEVILGEDAHIFVHEVGAAAVLSGVTLRQLHFEKGIPDAKCIQRAIRSADIHEPPTSLICLENALSNGRVIDEETMAGIYALAKSRGIPVHVDGARIFNAAAALQVDVRHLTQYTDTISCCLSKGLCAPVGTVIAGPAAFIERSRKYRKMLGGGMRQAGILAAAGILALTDMTKRLSEDHENARYMVRLLQGIDGVTLDESAVQINLVFFDVDRPQQVLDAAQQRMLERGVKINGADGNTFRFVTSNDVTRADIDYAVAAFAQVLGAQ